MAEIFAGLRETHGRHAELIVLKRARPDLPDPDRAEAQLRHEAELTLSFAPHSHLVRTLGVTRLGGQYCLVLELIEGEPLSRVIEAASARKLSLSSTMVSHLGCDIALGLSHLHEQLDGKGKPRPIVHADLNPQNVLVGADGSVKIADMGIAEVVRGVVPRSWRAGKVGYLSPEQAAGKPLDTRSDLFSLGVVLYELLGGSRVFPERDEEEALQAVQRFSLKQLEPPPEATPPLWKLLKALLQPSPEKRLEHTFDVVEVLRSSAGAVGTADVRTLFANAFPNWTSPVAEERRALVAR
jgi:serine/threonine-protein kinase